MSIDKQIVTPCYVIHKDELIDLMDKFTKDVKSIYSNVIIAYSYKTNYYSEIIKSAKCVGMWAEVVSEDEYYLAKKIGYTDKIIFNGPVKSYDSFIDAMENGVIVNLDSIREVEWLETLPKSKIYQIGIRLNYKLSKYCNEVMENDEAYSRFGFDVESKDFDKVLDRIRKLNNINICGFQMHRSGNSRSVEIYKSMIYAAKDIAQKKKINLDFIDLGGGMKLGVSEELTAISYMEGIKEALEKTKMNGVHIILEPGNSLVYRSVDYIAKVIDIKYVGKNCYATLDGSRIHTDPLFKKIKYLGVEIQSESKLKHKKIYLCGFTCKETDRFTILNNQQIDVGDYVIFKQIGSYTMSLVPSFIEGFPRVYIIQGGKISIQKDKEML